MNTVAPFELDKLNLKKIAKNLQILLKKRGVSESDIAQSLNIPVMTVRRLVSGETTDPRISTLKLLADFFEVSIDTLIEEKYPPTIRHSNNKPPIFVPILNWSIAFDFSTLTNSFLKDWKDWYPINLVGSTALGSDAFALESKPSMQPRFPLGTLFIIDPHVEHLDGDIALIKIKKHKELSLRELIIDPPRWQLQPLIQGSDILYYDTKEHSIVGIVMLTIFHARRPGQQF